MGSIKIHLKSGHASSQPGGCNDTRMLVVLSLLKNIQVFCVCDSKASVLPPFHA